MNLEHVSPYDLFVTDEFRRSGWLRSKCQMAEQTVGKIWTTNHPMPPGHFGTYFGALQRRAYANPWIQDLYHFHELTHVLTLRYDPASSWMEWSRRMVNSEMQASLASECYVYLHIEGLREKTFAHEIWVDRFLAAPDRRGVLVHEEKIRKERLRALNAPDYDDFLEHQIHNYARQNIEWCMIWSEHLGGDTSFQAETAFRLVEKHMASPERDATHQGWIEGLTESSGPDTAPFLKQALAFMKVYQASNQHFGNWIFAR
jgi:hypothetical protein